MRPIVLGFGVLLIAACGTGEEAAQSPQEVARAWVAAVNAQDWEGVCSLSVTDDPSTCPDELAASALDESAGGMQVEGFYSSDGVTKFTVTTAETRGETPPKEAGWTAYAPLELAVVEHDGHHRVHFEITVIR